MPFRRISAVRAADRWKRRSLGTWLAVVIAIVAAVGPVIGVSPEGANPAEVESKAGVVEADDLLAPGGPPLDLGQVRIVDLGAHGPRFCAVSVPFLEVPEDPPETL